MLTIMLLHPQQKTVIVRQELDSVQKPLNKWLTRGSRVAMLYKL